MRLDFTKKIKKAGWTNTGIIYVPAELMKEYKLLNKMVRVHIEVIE